MGLAQLGSRWGVGDQLPPTIQLAELLGTGIRSTHLAVHELAREGWLDRRPRVGTVVRRVPEGSETTPTPPQLLRAAPEMPAPNPRLEGRAVRLLQASLALDGMFHAVMQAAQQQMIERGLRVI